MRRFAKIRDLLKDESGATSIEYALLAGGIGLALVATVATLGSNVNAMWSRVPAALH